MFLVDRSKSLFYILVVVFFKYFIFCFLLVFFLVKCLFIGGHLAETFLSPVSQWERGFVNHNLPCKNYFDTHKNLQVIVYFGGINISAAEAF